MAYHAETLRAFGLYEEAIDGFTAAISLSPLPQYHYLRGCSLKALGRVAEAEEDFRLAGNYTGQLEWFPPKYNQVR